MQRRVAQFARPQQLGQHVAQFLANPQLPLARGARRMRTIVIASSGHNFIVRSEILFLSPIIPAFAGMIGGKSRHPVTARGRLPRPRSTR
jgi:hypothetical protein